MLSRNTGKKRLLSSSGVQDSIDVSGNFCVCPQRTAVVYGLGWARRKDRGRGACLAGRWRVSFDMPRHVCNQKGIRHGGRRNRPLTGFGKQE